MKISVNSKILSAIQSAIDSTATRPYLRGFYVDTCSPGRATIVGTNGTLLVSAEVSILSNDDIPESKESIFYPVKLTSRSLRGADVIIDTAEKTATIGGKTQSLEQPTTTVEYVRWNRIKADYDTDDEARKTVGRVSFDVSLIAPVSHALKAPTFHYPPVFTFGTSENDPIKVSWDMYPEVNCVLMPCRV